MTAIEYGLIAAGISVAIIAVVNGLPSITWEEDFQKERAARACSSRPAGTTDVVVKSWNGMRVEYKCSSWPKFFYPTYVRHQ